MLKVNVLSNCDGEKLQNKNPQATPTSLFQAQHNPWPQTGAVFMRGLSKRYDHIFFFLT